MRLLALTILLTLASCTNPSSADKLPAQKPKVPANAKTATFAGGCFWCMQPPFDKLDGVISTSVGYSGGSEVNPTYGQVSGGRTTHVESIYVVYDPVKVSYEKLVDTFWRNINPTQKNGQFADKGPHYRTVIFYADKEQQRVATASKEKLDKSGKFSEPIVTEITAATEFYPAEEYHQKYYLKNPGHYNAYKHGSGRAGYIKRVWGE